MQNPIVTNKAPPINPEISYPAIIRDNEITEYPLFPQSINFKPNPVSIPDKILCSYPWWVRIRTWF